MKNAQYFRNCPQCGTKLFYSAKSRRNAQEKCGGICYSCRAKSRVPMSEETKKKISIKAQEKFRNFSESQWQKMREDGHKYGLLQLPLSENERLARCGQGNHFYGHTHTDEVKRKVGDRCRGKKLSTSHKMKISEGLKRNGVNVGDKNVAKRPEDRLRKRLFMINKIKSEYDNMFPFYNKKACKYFDNLSIERGWDLQHGENGGEYYLRELGYWLDAYDKDKNIVVEYDECKHYNIDGSLKERDVRRMNEIIDHLKCSFYRYDERNQRFYQVI